MNYAWEFTLAAERQGMTRQQLHFRQAENASPYFESAYPDMNLVELPDEVVPVNTLFRFPDVFCRVLDVNIEEYSAFREVLLDVLMHYFVQLDLRQGLSRSEYYIRFLLKDFLGGALGEEYNDAIKQFTAKELKRVLLCILTLFRTGTSILLFRKAIKAVFPDSLVYSSNDKYREVLIYIGIKETERERKKVDFLTSVFLNLNYEVYLFWEHHFGIIDVEETLHFDDMVIF